MKLLARYKAWREHADNAGDGPIIWWPISRLRVYFALENWALPLSAEWVDSGESIVSRDTKVHEQGLVISLLCFAFYIDFNIITRVVVV